MLEREDKQKTSLKRRFFLKSTAGVALTGLSASVLSSELSARTNWEKLHNQGSEDHFWKKVKDEFYLDKKTTYMNIGTTGSMPKSVLKDYNKNNHIVAKNPWDMQGKFGHWPYVSEMITKIAPGFGALPNEIILSRNTTDGMCSILNGLHFEEGDVILTTHHEHVAANSPFHVITQRYGVEVVYLDIPVYTGHNKICEQDFVDIFMQAVLDYGTRVRLISFSHITYKTGTALPAKRICQEVAIPNNIPTLIDGAHTVGMFNLDFHDIGCDFYAGSGHKWQCGAGATGILFVLDSAKRLDQYWNDRENPLWFVNSSLGHADFLGTQLQLQYIGNDNYPAKQALCDACQLWDVIGRKKIEKRILQLSKLCKELLLDAFPNAHFYAPNISELSSGLSTFNPYGDQHNLPILTDFRDQLREKTGFIVRTTDFKVHSFDTQDVYALRISTHLFHSKKDVIKLVNAMQEIYQTI